MPRTPPPSMASTWNLRSAIPQLYHLWYACLEGTEFSTVCWHLDGDCVV
jgi:hypothetical protein